MQIYNILEKEDILINSEAEYLKHGDTPGDPFTLPYSEESIRQAHPFKIYYEKIKDLLTKENCIIVGHAVVNDVEFLKEACNRYDLEQIDFKFYDTQALYSKINDTHKSISLENMCKKFHLQGLENLHNSCSDALLTMQAFQVLCKEKTIFEFLDFHSDCKGSIKKGKIKRMTYKFCEYRKVYKDKEWRCHVYAGHLRDNARRYYPSRFP